MTEFYLKGSVHHATFYATALKHLKNSIGVIRLESDGTYSAYRLGTKPVTKFQKPFIIRDGEEVLNYDT